MDPLLEREEVVECVFLLIPSAIHPLHEYRSPHLPEPFVWLAST